ncbi:TniQ family protein, partial [Leptospira sp. 96542]|nr:TniQ family protein [Leptospira sp. 96542]
MSELEFPVKIDPHPDESGYGYLLRAMRANGANLHALRRVVGLSESKELRKVHAPLLGRIFGVSPQWLASALFAHDSTKSAPEEFFGHGIYLRDHLRRSSPQVCVRCVHQHGYCKALWDLALCTVCLEHRSLLTDQCGKCGQPLRWNRPSPDVGHCSHYLKSPEDAPSICDEALELQALLEQKFHAQEGSHHSASGMAPCIPSWLKSASLGPLMIYLTAFGAIDASSGRGKFSRQQRSTSTWHQIGLHGLHRCREFDPLSSERCPDPQSLVVHLLERLLSSDDGDASAAFSVLRRLDWDSPSRSPNLKQMTL